MSRQRADEVGKTQFTKEELDAMLSVLETTWTPTKLYGDIMEGIKKLRKEREALNEHQESIERSESVARLKQSARRGPGSNG